MAKTISAGHYRQIIRDAFDARMRSNPRYSLRAFARDLGLPPSRLSEVLSGKQGLSRSVASRISQALHLAPDDADMFCDMVDMHHARSPAQREAARGRVERFFQYQKRYNSLEIDQFRSISEWYHLAILELFHLRGAQSEVGWIADRLGISLPEASAAIDRLVRLGLLTQKSNGMVQPAHEVNSTVQAETPSSYIRSYHRRILQKAIFALEEQPVARREFSTLALSVRHTDLPKAKERIRKFWQDFCEEFNCASDADSVYCQATQFFSLTRDQIDQ
jgi:uncharacterized protein (TIGR02147 family)